MRLNELLKCVAVDSVKHKNYKRRGQLPFRDKDEFSIPPGEKLHARWTDFSLEEALRLQVMVDLSDYKSLGPQKETAENKLYDGLPPMSASSIASEGIGISCNKYRGLSGLRGQDFDIWHVVVVNVGGVQVGLVVDLLVGQEEVVIKPLGALLQGLDGMAGATITSDGKIALILDVPGLMRKYARRY